MKKPKFMTAYKASGNRTEPPVTTLASMAVLHNHYQDMVNLHRRMTAPAAMDSTDTKLAILSAEIRLMAAMLCLAAGYPVSIEGHIAAVMAASPPKPVATSSPKKPAVFPTAAEVNF